MVPFDDKSPFVTSGFRVGTAAITSRGLVEEHIPRIVEMIDTALMNKDDESVLTEVKRAVNEMMVQFPLFASSSKTV